jgi:hypothetical protein
MSGVVGICHFGMSSVVESAELLDPKTRKALKAALQQMDLAVYAANREIIGRVLPDLGPEDVVRFATVVAERRAQYVKEALRLTHVTRNPSPAEIAALGALRTGYEELSHAFDAIRRLIERGYSRMVHNIEFSTAAR